MKYLIIIACFLSAYSLKAQTREMYDKPLNEVINDFRAKYSVTIRFTNDTASLLSAYELNAQTFSEMYDQPLGEVLNDIQKKYHVTIRYSNNMVKDKVVTFAIWRMNFFDVEETLSNILYPFDLRFRKEGEKTYRIVPFVHWMKTEAEGAAHLKALLDLYPTLQQWETRKESVRNHILQQAGLDPFPQKNPLNPKFVNKRSYDLN